MKEFLIVVVLIFSLSCIPHIGEKICMLFCMLFMITIILVIWLTGQKIYGFIMNVKKGK